MKTADYKKATFKLKLISAECQMFPIIFRANVLKKPISKGNKILAFALIAHSIGLRINHEIAMTNLFKF